MIKCENKI